jgi:hypothetical protein
MAVTKLSNSGIKTGILKYDSMLAGNAAYDPAATWLIQRITAVGTETSITFSSIPTTYTSLQVRFMSRRNGAGSHQIYLRPNSDSTTNKAYHRLSGNGTAASAAGVASNSRIYISDGTSDDNTAGIFGVGIVDIHDYNSSTRNKTTRHFAGYDLNGSGVVYLTSGLFNTTTAITSLQFEFGGDTLDAGSTFALYGFKGA